MSPLKLVLLALALVLPGGSLLILAMAAVNAFRARRPALAAARVPKALPPGPGNA